MEQELKIYSTAGRNGKTYKNIYLKTRVDKFTNTVFEGLTANNSVVLEKAKYAKGLEKDMGDYKFYICSVMYKGEECSVTLSEREHDAFSQIGGVGDKVRVTAKADTNKKTGKPYMALVFEPAN